MVNGQLAKLYQMPVRMSGALSDSNEVGSQSAYESAIDMEAAIMAKGNFILHAVGIMESCNCVSYEKLVLGNEVIGYLKRIDRGVEVDDETFAYDVIEEVGSCGTCLLEDHTVDYFRSECCFPKVSNRQSYVVWKNDGAITSEQRANRPWHKYLAEFSQSSLDAEADAQLKRYLADFGCSREMCTAGELAAAASAVA